MICEKGILLFGMEQNQGIGKCLKQMGNLEGGRLRKKNIS